MNRLQAKKIWPIIKAFAEGKQIEIKPKVRGSYWDILETVDIQYIDFKKYDLRIKPELNCRPFASANECFEEMQKHKPLGWVKHKNKDIYSICGLIQDDLNFEYSFKEYIFADGKPFGIVED